MRLKNQNQKPACPQKPPDLAQRVRSLMSQAGGEFTSTEFLPGDTDVTQSMCFMPSEDNDLNSSTTGKPQLTSKTTNGSFDDLDIPYIDEDEDLT